MTPSERIAAIRAREQAATLGPWTAKRMNMDDDGETAWEYECEPGDEQLYAKVTAPSHQIANTGDDEGSTMAPLAEFIANARADIPWLVARLGQAEDLLRDSRCDCPLSDCPWCTAKRAFLSDTTTEGSDK